MCCGSIGLSSDDIAHDDSREVWDVLHRIGKVRTPNVMKNAKLL